MGEAIPSDFLADRTAEMDAEEPVEVAAATAEGVGDLRRTDGRVEILADELERLPDGCVGNRDDVG